ncbi:hypothetical protein BGZ74_003504 [Mortierella antarctica]|nr:hypothetical protein BGZ74_003504 [Mortierella antarctica]
MALSSDHHTKRGLHYAGPALSVIGYILLIVTKNCAPAVQYIGLTTITSGSFSSLLTNVGGYMKRAVAIGFIISVGNL